MNITSTTEVPCSALLWDGYNFFNAYGYMKHTNLSRVYFWQTPDGMLRISKIIQQDVDSSDQGRIRNLCYSM